ncbi:hypothetical protein ISREJYDI_CDS0073 [Pseudomonas phage UNO-G1W1]|jgi:hypothetical protein|uniref:Uncharacterized protein n=1 Tax=Pseudomonas phage UNO-G1W1 TaxID=3136609 RepID=A0AAX4MVM1_9CAUD
MLQIETNINEVIELPESRNGIVDLELTDLFDHPAGQLARGYIYNDVKRGQFQDGDFIRTSIIKDLVTFQDELYIITLNTTYRVIGWVESPVPAALKHIL